MTDDYELILTPRRGWVGYKHWETNSKSIWDLVEIVDDERTNHWLKVLKKPSIKKLKMRLKVEAIKKRTWNQ